MCFRERERVLKHESVCVSESERKRERERESLCVCKREILPRLKCIREGFTKAFGMFIVFFFWHPSFTREP